MQYGQPGGYNVLKLGAQGNYLLFLNGESQRVGIGTDNPGAALEISSTTQGFLPPRMGQADIEALTPVTGLLVFNTTTLRPNYYDGVKWRNLDASVSFGIGVSCLGGNIAYILQSGDLGYDTNVTHGFIASPINVTGGQWGCAGTDIPGADGTAIGTGNQNTIDIVAGCSPVSAAKACADYTTDGYSGWYLPSKEELHKIYLNRVAIGNFGNVYWSSSEVSSTAVYVQSFTTGNEVAADKTSYYSVRCIRAF
jgi:hypothetical protein